MPKVKQPTAKQKIAICLSESGELDWQAKNHRAYARNGAKTQEDKDWHLGAALYKEAQARAYMELASKIEDDAKVKKQKKTNTVKE